MSTPTLYNQQFLDFLATLNPAQRRAVEQTEGPVLVIAGPGTGKTSTVVKLLALLVYDALEAGRADTREVAHAALHAALAGTDTLKGFYRVVTAVLVVGFPLGFHDTLHHMPVVRHAAIACESQSGRRQRHEPASYMGGPPIWGGRSAARHSVVGPASSSCGARADRKASSSAWPMRPLVPAFTAPRSIPSAFARAR